MRSVSSPLTSRAAAGASVAGLIGEVVDYWLRRIEPAVGAPARDEHTAVAERHDVGVAAAVDVPEQPRVLGHAPAARLVGKVVEHCPRRIEPAVGAPERDEYMLVAERHDVGTAVAVDVPEQPRVLGHAPAAGLIGEVVEHCPRRIEPAVGAPERDEYMLVAERHDVGTAVAVDVFEQPRVLGHAPAAGLVGKVVEHCPRRIEPAVGAPERDEYMLVAERHDVGTAVAVDVPEQPRVLGHAPAARLIGKVVEHCPRRIEPAVGAPERDEYMLVAERHDVGTAVAVDVPEQPRMFLNAPAAGLIGKVVDLWLKRIEPAVGAPERNEHELVAERHDVDAAIAVDVAEQPRVLLNAPAARLIGEVVDHRLRRIEPAVGAPERDEHKLVAERHDVGTAVAVDVPEQPRVLLNAPAARL